MAKTMDIARDEYGRDILTMARQEGRRAAEAAATWCVDGNTGSEHIARMLAMFADGDPEVYDHLPTMPNLSGEWADDPTPLSLARDVTGEDDPPTDLIDAIATEWEAGVDERFAEACEGEYRRWSA